jgi:hypothetical protein
MTLKMRDGISSSLKFSAKRDLREEERKICIIWGFENALYGPRLVLNLLTIE